MINRFAIFLSLLPLSGLAGCDVELNAAIGPDATDIHFVEGSSPEQEFSTLPDEHDVEAVFVRGGTPTSHSGIVKISMNGASCTGFFLNSRTIVTAAHCLPEHGNEGGSVHVASIAAYRTTPYIPAQIWNGNVVYERHPKYNKDTLTFSEHDIGYIRNYQQDWPGTNYEDYLRIYQDFGSRINSVLLWGAGFATHSGQGLGVLRNHQFELSGWPSYSYDKVYTEGTDKFNVCRGDSGGPVMKVVNEMEFVVGVNSEAEIWPNEECSSGDTLGIGGGDQTATRVNPNHLNWIVGQTNAECVQLNAHSYEYKRCFSIPFINSIPEEGLSQSLAVAITMATIL